MANFNSYLERMDLDFWREMCHENGTLRHYEPGDCFLEEGSVARYMGYVERGTLKYVATDSRGNGHVFNFEFPGGFVASFPDSIYNRKSKYSVIANSDSDIWCLPIVLLRERLFGDKDFELVIAKTSEHVFGQVYDMLLDSYSVSRLVPAIGVKFKGARAAYMFMMNGRHYPFYMNNYLKKAAPEFKKYLEEYFDKSPDKKAHQQELKDNPAILISLYEDYLKTHDPINDPAE